MSKTENDKPGSYSSEVALNTQFFKERLATLAIKQWWLAEQIGVDRKTVARWLSGKVKKVHRENAERLAGVLSCTMAEICLANEADQFATADDQRTAASLLLTSQMLDKLGPIGEWGVIESLIKATLIPNLPTRDLGELYDRMTIASWRQSKIEQAELFNQKTEEIARKTESEVLLASALMSKANLYSWRGQTRSAIETFQECLSLEPYLDPRLLGSIYSNFGAVLYESGDLSSGEERQKQAIEFFKRAGRPTNLSIAYGHLAMIHLQQKRMNDAQLAVESSLEFAKKDEYRRGSHMAALILAEIAARNGDSVQAIDCLHQGLNGFKSDGIDEGLNYEFAARVSRLLGDVESAENYVNQGIQISSAYPIYLAALQFEKALIFCGRDESKAREAASKSARLYEACQAVLRKRKIENLFRLDSD